MAIYYKGNLVNPTLVVPHDIYDDVVQATNNIELLETATVYNIKPTSEVTISFNTSNLTLIDTKYVTFMLVLDMTDGVQNVIWPNNVTWGNISPTMTANVHYMFSFTKPAGSNIWIGNQMFSW